MAFTASKPELLTTPKIQAQGQVGRTFVFRIVNFLCTPTFLLKATGSIVLKHRPHTHTHMYIHSHPVANFRVSRSAQAFIYEFLLFFIFATIRSRPSEHLLPCGIRPRLPCSLYCFFGHLTSIAWSVSLVLGHCRSKTQVERLAHNVNTVCSHTQLNFRKSSMLNPILIKIVLCRKEARFSSRQVAVTTVAKSVPSQNTQKKQMFFLIIHIFSFMATNIICGLRFLPSVFIINES